MMLARIKETKYKLESILRKLETIKEASTFGKNSENVTES